MKSKTAIANVTEARPRQLGCQAKMLPYYGGE